MCNIVGYAGKKAAPKLLEMLRLSQGFDIAKSVGIATVHQGRIYYTKSMGNVDVLTNKTDAANLPGDIGIGIIGSEGNFQDRSIPIVSKDGMLAMVMNGTAKDDRNELYLKRSRIAERLLEKGVRFSGKDKNPDKTYPRLSDGSCVSYGEVMLNLMYDYILSYRIHPADSLAKSLSDMYTDISVIALYADRGDSLFVNRIMRPMSVMSCDDGTYIATSKFAFPRKDRFKILSNLPIMKSCIVHSEGYEITPYQVWGSEPEMLTREDYSLCYDMILSAISKHSGLLTFGDICTLVYSNRDIMKDYDGTVKYAELIHDVIYDLWREGRIKHPSSLMDSNGQFLFEIQNL